MNRPLKLTYIADLHHYSQTLGTAGHAYELRAGSDQKCLAETGAVIDAAFAQIAASDTDAVLIAGDVTNDGELVSHMELREKLYRLAEKKRVCLLTSTHDWCCDGNPRRFDGARVSPIVPTMPHEAIRDFYFDFGVRNAIADYKTHLGISSYVAQLCDGVRLLALCDDQNGRGRAGYTEAHFQWIEAQLQKAEADGCLMLGMQHHLLLPHINPLLTGGCCVGDREKTAARLADAGLHFMFVGHSHIQHTADFVSPRGNRLVEVNIGSLCGYPAPLVQVEVQPDYTVQVDVDHLKAFLWHGRRVDAQVYLKKHAADLVDRVLQSRSPREMEERVTALQMNGRSVSKFYFALRPFLRFINDSTVCDVYRRARALGLTRSFDPTWLEAWGQTPLLDVVHDFLFAALDGSQTAYGRDSSYYKMVLWAMSLPAHIFKKNTAAKKLVFTADEILTGGKINNQHAVFLPDGCVPAP